MPNPIGNLDVPTPASLTPAEYRKFCDLAYKRCGLNMQDGKEQLVTARLQKVMRAEGIASFEQYYQHVTGDNTGKALEGLLNALTTNHTSFFRESNHFEYFQSQILPALDNRGQIAVWSAACSTGEEPYSIAFSVLETLSDAALGRLNILATDVSTRVLNRAQRGLFETDRVSTLSNTQLRRFFLRGEGQWADWYMVKKPIRERIEFRRFNLVEGFNQTRKFPLIFCRNVMIYFDAKTQEQVVNSLTQCLEPGGHLFIGHSESLGSISHQLQFVAPAIYRKSGTSPAGASR